MGIRGDNMSDEAPQNDLFRKQNAVNSGIRTPFSFAKDREVTPGQSPSSISADRTGSQTNAPVTILPDGYVNTSEATLVAGTPVQRDGTIVTKLPNNVQPGPNSMPWWRRDIDNVPNGSVVCILNVTVPEGRVYRLKRVGHTFWSAQDEFWITYDDKNLNDSRWSFPLGAPGNATMYPLQVTVSAVKEFRCYVRNRSGMDRNYEFMLDGWFDPVEYSQGAKTM